jgi:hypothetical protein
LCHSRAKRRIPASGSVRAEGRKRENRFAEILRLQQLPLRMTQDEDGMTKRKMLGKGSGFFYSL